MILEVEIKRQSQIWNMLSVVLCYKRLFVVCKVSLGLQINDNSISSCPNFHPALFSLRELDLDENYLAFALENRYYKLLAIMLFAGSFSLSGCCATASAAAIMLICMTT